MGSTRSWHVFPLIVTLAVLSLPGLASARPQIVIALGDSLTAGNGVSQEEAYPAVLERLLRQRGIDARVVNAGISGDTTLGIMRRLDEAVPSGADLVILEAGSNDRKLGYSGEAVHTNIEQIVRTLRSRRIGVVLTAYWDKSGADIARREGAVFAGYPFDGLYRNPAYVGPDGRHMSASGNVVVAERLLPAVLRGLGRR